MLLYVSLQYNNREFIRVDAYTNGTRLWGSCTRENWDDLAWHNGEIMRTQRFKSPGILIGVFHKLKYFQIMLEQTREATWYLQAYHLVLQKAAVVCNQTVCRPLLLVKNEDGP